MGHLREFSEISVNLFSCFGVSSVTLLPCCIFDEFPHLIGRLCIIFLHTCNNINEVANFNFVNLFHFSFSWKPPYFTLNFERP